LSPDSEGSSVARGSPVDSRRKAMGLSDLLDRAKGIVQKRGGTDALKEDAEELKDVATSDASLSEKMKQGAEAVKDPGAKGPEPGAEGPEPGAEGPEPGAEGPEPGAKGPDPGTRRPRQ
jgi:hypothetical protein